MPHSKNYPSVLTPDERLQELTAILGQGLLRFFGSGAMDAESCGSTPCGYDTETVQKALDVSPTSDPVVSRLTQERS